MISSDSVNTTGMCVIVYSFAQWIKAATYPQIPLQVQCKVFDKALKHFAASKERDRAPEI